MIRLKRILLPTDFSECSKAATKYACGLAERFDAELHVLHVLQLTMSSTPTFGGGLAISSIIKESKEAAEKALSHVLDPQWEAQWGERRQVVRTTVEGAPHREIIHYAMENDIDLIVLGTHGHSGLEHALMGSVAEKVVRKSRCPVLTVRPDAHQFITS